MATQQQVLETHRLHPDWSANTIATVLDCSAGYVRATAQRLKIALPPAKPDSIEALGHAAREAGLTVAGIQAIAKLRIPALAAAIAVGVISAITCLAFQIAGASL